jgi:hypothetical protein
MTADSIRQKGGDPYSVLRSEFIRIIETRALDTEKVVIRAGALSPQEAIGNPEHKDYPLIKGKEQAEFRGCFGQAFTDMYGNFTATLSEIVRIDLTDNFKRAIFVSSLNAVLRYLGIADKTVHCKDDEPPRCARALLELIKERYSNPRIAMIGLQPRMVQELSLNFQLRVTDLDTSNIGKVRFGIVIDGPEKTESNLDWCDLALVTGTTVTNNTLPHFLIDKPTIFYGVTISGTAKLLSLNHFCHCGH